MRPDTFRQAPDACGFYSDPMLAPLVYSSGLPVMRDDVELLYHAAECRFFSRAAGCLVVIPAFDPDAHTDDELARIGVFGGRGVTDLASIPRPGRAFIPPNGRILKPSIKHDDAYAERGWGLITRAQADAELREDLALMHASWLQQQSVFYAVRLGGANGWGH